MSESWEKELDVAVEAAWSAGRVTLRWFQAGPTVDIKSDGSPVTDADRQAEAAVRQILGARFPDDGIAGEEYGEQGGRSGRRWIIDPIDGTRSFVHGVPLYGVMVALEAEGDAVVSAIAFPALGELVAAGRGLGCRWNGRPCRVSGQDRLDRALVLTSGDARPPLAGPKPSAPPAPEDDGLQGRLRGLRRLELLAGTYRTWGDCYGYALVATGRADAMLDPVVQVWDAAPVRPLIEEAGGVFSDWTGRPTHTAGHAVGTNARLAERVRAELERAELDGAGPERDGQP
jgi:histidinol-phosphatase